MKNDSSVDAIGIGAFKLHFRGGSALLLHHVLHVPKIQRNLLSVLKLLVLGLGVDFHKNSAFISVGFDQQLVNFCHNGLFCIDLISPSGFANKRYFYYANYVDIENDFIFRMLN